jgi:peptide deformylase
MSTLPIVIYPDQRLKQRAAEVTVFDANLEKLVNDMCETMYVKDGIGLAANQIGVLQRVIVVDVSEDRSGFLALVNPKILKSEGKGSREEGCLSIPGYREVVSRKTKLTVEYQDLQGQKVSLEAEDLLAICLQHEIDHIDGILFVDRISSLKRQLFLSWVKSQQERGEDIEE